LMLTFLPNEKLELIITNVFLIDANFF